MATVQVTMFDRFFPHPVDETYRRLIADISSRSGFRFERPDATTLVVVRRYTPTWAVVLAIIGIFVFLLGLLFLLAKTEERVTIIGRDVEGGAVFQVTGQTDKLFADFLNEVFPASAPAPATAS
jgi:hypothetical protein